MIRQLTFDLPMRPALGREDFFVSPANAVALALLDSPGDWSQRRLIVMGPPGSGKTHLAHVWAEGTDAQIIHAGELGDPDRLARGPLAVEGADTVAGDARAETTLFHLHNLMVERRHPLLLTARTAPGRWGLALPDLASRMAAVQMAQLSAPDDALLAAVLAKQFADRGIAVPDKLIPYLLPRMERSFDAARALVGALDDAALAAAKPVTLKLAARILDDTDQTGPAQSLDKPPPRAP